MILLAADAWLALVDRAHGQHASCVRALKDLEEPIVTVWPVVSDVLAELAAVTGGQDVVWQMIGRGAIRLAAFDEADVAPVQELMSRNATRRMTFADAAAIHVARRDGIRSVFTLGGKRLAGYRVPGGRRLKAVP